MISGMRNGTYWFLAMVVCLVSLHLADAEEAKPLPWVEGSTTLVLLPDTQFYTDKFPEFHFFEAQTKWCAEMQKKRNIAYVLHLGDITDNNTADEWEIARESFRSLDGKVPYALVPGNHDLKVKGSDRNTLMNKYFSVADQRKMPTFGGVFEEGRLDNSYHCFTIGECKWIILALECAPRDEVVAWANKVLDEHADHLAILDTHAYLSDDSTRLDHESGKKQHNISEKWGNDGEQLWQKLVKGHANMMIVVCGHVHGVGCLASKGDHGNTVNQILVDYQSNPRGGKAYLRLLEFLPDGKTVQARSYSPAVDRYKTDSGNQFTFTLKFADKRKTSAAPQRASEKVAVSVP